MKVKDLFKTLATRAGINATEAKLTTLIEALPDLDADDELIANVITGNLITESEAENRPKIKGKFRAEALNGIDALLDPALSDFFDAEELATIKADKDTSKRLVKILTKAKELKTAGGSPTELAKQVEELNKKITQLKTDAENSVNKVRSEYEQKLYFNGLAGKVLARSDVNEFGKAKEGKRVITDLQEAIEAAGGVLDFSTGLVMQKADPSMKLFIDNKQVSVNDLLEKTLKDNNYIKKSDGPAPANPVQVPTNPPNGPQQANGAIMRNIQLATAAAKASEN